MSAWREALAGVEEATRVAPPDRARIALAPEKITVALSERLSTALRQQARRQGLTLNTIIQAAWAILLGRLTGRDDVVFGVTVAGRPPEIAGIESMVGLFINTLPLRIKVAPDKPLRELFRQVQDSQSGLLAHQHLGLSDIQSLTGLGELFDTLVVFENYPVDRSGLSSDAGGLRLTSFGGVDATHYPLSLAVGSGERFQLRFNYRPDLFERASVEALAQRLIRLLAAAVGAPDRAIGSIDILTAEERHRILENIDAANRPIDRKSTRLNSSHANISYAVFCLKKKKRCKKAWARIATTGSWVTISTVLASLSTSYGTRAMITYALFRTR